MARLTAENAHLYYEKRLDSFARRFHNYPLEVIKIAGEYHVKDRLGVCMPIHPERDRFNGFDFDFVVDDCFKPNEDPYPLCRGNGSDECINCGVYEKLDSPPFGK